jgi:hypothetical protein
MASRAALAILTSRASFERFVLQDLREVVAAAAEVDVLLVVETVEVVEAVLEEVVTTAALTEALLVAEVEVEVAEVFLLELVELEELPEDEPLGQKVIRRLTLSD